MTDPRRVALDALVRIEEGAYANLVVPALLTDVHLDQRDRNFVTELVYGTTRMRRACDWLLERFVLGTLDQPTRAALRLGTYQLAFLQTPAHAAVDATVTVAPRRTKGVVNAILRRVAAAPVAWPDEATRLSYPDWVVERLAADLGDDEAMAALAQMNQPAHAEQRPDGYIQDLGSQWVAEAVGAQGSDRVGDFCAAPGGKATLMAHGARLVVAADVRPGRAGLVQANAAKLGLANVATVVADALHPPVRKGAFDRILLDAPCSNLGTLRRRPDARWRTEADDVAGLTLLQHDLLESAIALLEPGQILAYSVCTLTSAEGIGHDDHLRQAHPELTALPPPEPPWRPHGRGALLLPQDAGTDGMQLFRYVVTS